MSNKRSGRMPKQHVEAVRERSRGVCEGCGRKKATDIHHRRTLARGGLHNIANLVALCGGEGFSGGNHSGCHGLAHSGDAPAGWLISRYEKAAESAIHFVDLSGAQWRFQDDGEKVLIPAGIPF